MEKFTQKIGKTILEKNLLQEKERILLEKGNLLVEIENRRKNEDPFEDLSRIVKNLENELLKLDEQIQKLQFSKN